MSIRERNNILQCPCFDLSSIKITLSYQGYNKYMLHLPKFENSKIHTFSELPAALESEEATPTAIM